MLVGEPARRQAAANLEGTATAFTHRMGRRETVASRFLLGAAFYLLSLRIKRDAEAYLGEPVETPSSHRCRPIFVRDGSNLWREERIAIPNAVLGTSLKVPTLNRTATVRVPPGTEPGTVFRLRGKGLPVFGGTRHGDLLVRVLIDVPQHLEPEEKKLYEELRKLQRSVSPMSTAYF